MGKYGDSISTTTPLVADAETAASQAASDLLAEFKARLTAKVTPAEMTVDATLDMASQALENATYMGLVDRASKPTPVLTVYSKNDTGAGELYFQDSAGNEVQLTESGALNNTAPGGGTITGAGYGSGGVAVNWNAAGTNYQFKSGSGADDYAALTCDGVQLRDGSSHHVLLDTPPLASNYTLTLPAGTSAGLVTADGSGNLSFESTIPDVLTWSGAQTFSSGVTMSPGTTTTLDDVVVQTGAVIDFSGGGSGSYVGFGDYLPEIRHGDIRRSIQSGSMHMGSGVAIGNSTVGFSITNPTGATIYYVNAHLPVREGERIKEVRLYVTSETLDNNLTWGLYSNSGTNTTWSAHQTTVLASTGLQTMTLTTPLNVADASNYAIRLLPVSATGSVTVSLVDFLTDKIA